MPLICWNAKTDNAGWLKAIETKYLVTRKRSEMSFTIININMEFEYIMLKSKYMTKQKN